MNIWTFQKSSCLEKYSINVIQALPNVLHGGENAMYYLIGCFLKHKSLLLKFIIKPVKALGNDIMITQVNFSHLPFDKEMSVYRSIHSKMN